MQLIKFPMSSISAAVAVYILLFTGFCQAQQPVHVHPLRGHGGAGLPPIPNLSKASSNSAKYTNGSACIESPPAYTPAPKHNVWSQLGYAEVVAVREFMYKESGLNITPGYGYYGYYGYSNGDGTRRNLGTIELNPPNKTAVVPYLEGTGPEPLRYARTQILTSTESYSEAQEIIVGPIGSDQPMTWAPLTYPYTRPGGKIVEHFKPEHFHAAEVISHQIRNGSQDILQTLWPYLNHTWGFGSYGTQIPAGDGKTDWWYSAWTYEGENCYYIDSIDGGIPLSLYYGIQIDDADPKNPTFLGWVYDNVKYPTTESFRKAVKYGNVTRPEQTKAGAWCEGGQHGPTLPMDEKPPPQAIAPAGSRFYLDHPSHYVQWMDFSFYMGWSGTRGWAFYDIRHKGQRILYELSLQEALAHYAGSDPAQSLIWYRDASIGMGGAIVELVKGYDCPEYAAHWDTHIQYNDKPYRTKNSVCFFEFNGDFPIARHSGGNIASRKNIYFVVRSVYTVGNYDYMFSYEFYLDGSIKVTVRASGYIQGQGAVGNHEYGYDIHQGYSGGIHDHVLNFKADFDILGTANTMYLTSFVPTDQTYAWTSIPRETFKLKREVIKSEDESRLNWDRATQYTVVNTDQPNEWGEYRGYRIMPADGTTHFTNTKSSNAKELIHPFTFDLAATKFHDEEPQSVSPEDSYDLEDPLINFNDFFNGESLVQEDLVTWINLGMHHLPHTGDLPLTLFTTAHASVQFQPLNYYKYEIATQSLSQVKIDFRYNRGNETVGEVNTFGQQPAWCSIDLSKEAPDLFHSQGYSYYK